MHCSRQRRQEVGGINEQKDDYLRSLSPLCPFPRSIEHIVSGSGSGGIHCTCTIAVSCCFRREERFQLILSIFVRTIIVERYAFSFAFLLKSPPAVCQNIVSFAWRKRERELYWCVCVCGTSFSSFRVLRFFLLSAISRGLECPKRTRSRSAHDETRDASACFTTLHPRPFSRLRAHK